MTAHDRDDELAYGERMLRWADPSDPEGDGVDPVCERCGLAVPGGESAFAPYCSRLCLRAARHAARRAAAPCAACGAPWVPGRACPACARAIAEAIAQAPAPDPTTTERTRP